MDFFVLALTIYTLGMETVQERSVDSLTSLEERITRAVHLITDLRAQNAALAKKVSALEEEVKAGAVTQHEMESHNAELMQQRNDLEQKLKQQGNELDEIRGERKEVRTRIEKLLSQLDLLSAS
jgi:chromosome segregation ATPase